MTPVRRRFLRNSAAVLSGLNFAPQSGQWHTYEVTTRTDIARRAGVTRVWRPVPSVNSSYPQSLESSFYSSAAGKLMQDGQDGAKMLDVEFAADCASAAFPARKSRFFHGSDGRKCRWPARSLGAG